MKSENMSNRTKRYRQYSEKAIMKKAHPQFIGIAHNYSSAKKERIITQQIRDQYSHEVSTMNKINQGLEKSLKKKQKQLKYVREVRDRYVSQVLRKEKIRQGREMQLERLKQKTIEEGLLNKIRVNDAKKKLLNYKKKEKQETVSQLKSLKSQRRLKQSQIWETNHSRVKMIEEDKKRISDYCNRFFQNRNKKFMMSYKQLIGKEKKDQIKSKAETQNLERKLLVLKDKAKDKQKMLEEINNSLNSIRDSGLSRRSSRAFSTRSMTPLQFLTSSDTKNNPEKSKSIKK